MAYPYQISGTANTHFQYVGRVIARSATVLYKYLTNSASDTLEVWKSTDAGVTWAEADSGNSPTIFNGTVPINDADDGTRLWFMFKNGASAARLRAFNTSTDLWEAEITGGPTAADSSSGGPITPNAQYGIQVRSNGDKVVFYSVNGAGNIQEQWAQIYNGSWSAAQDVLVQNVSEAGYFAPYTNIGSVIDDDDNIHFFGWTPNGIAYIRFNADNSTSNYHRFGIDSLLGENTGGRSGVYGQPRITTLGQTDYASLPHGFIEVVDGDTFIRPGMISFPITGSATDSRIDLGPEYMNNLNFSSIGINWLSCCVAYDSTTGVTWLIWLDDISTAFDYQTSIKAVGTRGANWSTVATIYTTALDQLIETMEVSVDNGLFRAVIENSTTGTFLSPHYWQSTLTDTAPTICTTDFSGQSLAGYNFSNADFTGATLTGATGLPATDCTPVVPVGADPPMPPVYPYVPSSGSVYARENLTANLKMIRGDTFVFKFVVVLNGVVVNITGNDFIMTCRYRPTETVVFTRTSDPADGIVLSDPTAGECTVTIDPEHTDFLNNSVLRFPYDVEMTDGSGNVSTVLYGTLTIYPDITYVDA